MKNFFVMICVTINFINKLLILNYGLFVISRIIMPKLNIYVAHCLPYKVWSGLFIIQGSAIIYNKSRNIFDLPSDNRLYQIKTFKISDFIDTQNFWKEIFYN